MFKKINNYLLEHYPLLWNMRLPKVLATIIAFHIMHIIVGYARYADEMDYYQQPDGVYFSTTFFSFSIIGAIIIFILWLTRVFRNNAFRNFYPFSNKQLFGQFGIILLVCLLNITYYYSYTIGYVMHSRVANNYETSEADIKTYNKVIAFLENNKEVYTFENRQYPLPFPISKQYNNRSNAEAVLEYKGIDGITYSEKEIDSIIGGEKLSYLNYNNTNRYINLHGHYVEDVTETIEAPNGIDPEIVEYPQNNLQYRAKELQQLLKNPDELKKAMSDFIALCKKNNIKYKLDADVWFKWVYHPPYFPVKYTIQQYYNAYEDANQVNPNGFYVDINKLTSKLTRTMRSYEYDFEPGVLCGFLYTALGMALLIFSIRATSRRVWLISIIGIGLITMIVGAFTAVFSFGMRDNGESFLFVYLLLIFGFLVGHFLSTKKNISGAMLNWFAWSLPYVSLIIVGFVAFDHSRSGIGGRNWIEKNVVAYFFTCFIIYILTYAFIIVPLYRKWQAQPED